MKTATPRAASAAPDRRQQRLKARLLEELANRSGVPVGQLHVGTRLGEDLQLTPLAVLLVLLDVSPPANRTSPIVSTDVARLRTVGGLLELLWART